MNNYMQLAFEEAEAAAKRQEIPVGAVVVSASGEVIGRAGNRTEELSDPTAHAEILALRAASQHMKSARLPECDLYVTLEPCPMCAAALSFARIRRIYYGAYDVKGGAIEHGTQYFNDPTCHHRPECIGGIDEERSMKLLKTFFQDRR